MGYYGPIRDSKTGFNSKGGYDVYGNRTVSNPRCTGITKNGSQCVRDATLGDGCRQYHPKGYRDDWNTKDQK
jgi:hypothetical protein